MELKIKAKFTTGILWLVFLYLTSISCESLDHEDNILKEKLNVKNLALKQVHKFSIGKDFSSLEQVDENKLLNITNNSIYSNIPPTLSTKPNKKGKNITIKTVNSTITKTSSRVTSLMSTTNRAKLTNSSKHQLSSTSKLDKLKKKLALIHEKTTPPSALTEVLDDVLTANPINYTNIAKGRSIEDTRAVLNYMLTALYQIKSKQQEKKFDSNKFLDQVFLSPVQVAPDGLFEKDIVLSKDQAFKVFSKYLTNTNSSAKKYDNKFDHANVRKVIKDTVYRWSLPIYFYLDSKYAEFEKELIRKSLKRWEESTCLEFEEIKTLETQVHYLRFVRGQGCWSPIGYVPETKYQDISLGEGCLNKGTILHEVGHTLGFFHEQSRPDRDEYVNIVRKNISPYGELNFEKYSDNEIASYEIPYDLSSDMHYGSLYFSSNSDITIEPKDRRYQRTIGQRVDLSFSDIKTANRMYCQSECPISLPCQRGGYPNPKNCKVCLCPDGFGGPLCDEVAQSIGICGGLIKNSSGLIQTPNYPLYYPGFISCNWLIQAPPGYRIRLSFSKLFSTTCDIYALYGPCDQDWLEIRENSNYFYQGGPRYCCTQGPNITTSVDNEIVIVFRSTVGNVNSNGFRALYEFIDRNGNVLTEPSTTNLLMTTTTKTQKTQIYTTKTKLEATKKLDYCLARPCLNGGTCFMTQQGFKCNCSRSFTGYRCESRISKCNEIKCENSGICLENLNSCLCPTGFTGERCEIPLDICSSNPCLKGVCVNLNSEEGYKCFCLSNYTGSRCEISLTTKHCRDDLCLNGGKCVESPLLEGFICKCPKNFHGIFCEKTLCSSSDICGANGTCYLKEDGSYYCKCLDGSIGDNCKSHPCLSNICGDFGICERVSSSTLDYKCKCTQGFTGKNCDAKISLCDSNPCLHGKCQDLFNFDYKCECDNGYVGKRCDIPFFSNSSKSVCYSNPCKNNGICFEKKNVESKYVCFCPPGFVGLNCEISFALDSDICSLKSGLCKNGRCVPMGNSYNCECQKNWLGPRCDLYNPCFNPNPCKNNGICRPTVFDRYICSCPSGFSGKNCEKIADKCPNDLCLNGGRCIIDNLNLNGYKCICLPNYIGPTCSFNLNSCLSNPCSLNQICKNKGYTYECFSINRNNLYSYSTKTSFSAIISAKIKTTQSVCFDHNPCKNDGICQEIEKLVYVCNCKFGYVGRHCDYIDQCLIKPNACNNNGVCETVEDKLTCKCKPGFEPPYCEKQSGRLSLYNSSTTFCQINVCKNGGTCVHANLYKNKMYGMKCLCKSGFGGIFCEKDIKIQILKENREQKHFDIPSICQLANNRSMLNQLRLVKLPFTNTSYYIIQDDLIWYANQGMIDNEELVWPIKITQLFSFIETPIDTILYDNFNNEILIFKANKYWRFKRNSGQKHSYSLLNGYPRITKDDYGIKNVQGGFFINQNSMFLFKDSKMVHYNRTKAIGIYFLPFQLNQIQFALGIDSEKFIVLGESRLYTFFLNFKSHQVFIQSIDSNIQNSFFCQPLLKYKLKFIKLEKNETKLKSCPDLSTINSIIKLNGTTAVMLSQGKKIDYLEYGINGYRLIDGSTTTLNLDTKTAKRFKTSMINLNRIVFIFQNDIVWIYSFLNDKIIENPSPTLFQNLFPTKPYFLNSIVSSHYSPKSKKFYFFTEKFYVEYENQNSYEKRESIRNLSSNLTNVIQNHEDFDSVYLVDSNNFYYYLNLKNDYLESVDRHTASLKLFSNCIHD